LQTAGAKKTARHAPGRLARFVPHHHGGGARAHAGIPRRSRPVGYNGAAEGFIFLSACLAGIVYGRTYQQADWTAMSRRAWKRTRQIYLVHLSVLVPIVLIVWARRIRCPRWPVISAIFSPTRGAVWRSCRCCCITAALRHPAALRDFLGVMPWLLAVARRRGWGMILAVSALGWLAAQCKLECPPHRRCCPAAASAMGRV